MSFNPTALVLDSGEGDLLTFVGISTRIKVRSEETNGAWTLIESTVEPHFKGFKLHVHQRMTETFYILAGTLTVRYGNEEMQAKAGSMIMVPPGVWHTYSNQSDERARYLLFMSPGGFEKYLEGLAEMIRTELTWPPADKTQLNALAEIYDATPG
jgi:mannose-6-phosphate isomerase-like protein (cupin superfamily)